MILNAINAGVNFRCNFISSMNYWNHGSPHNKLIKIYKKVIKITNM